VTCDRAPSFLGAYVLGALDPAERRAADAHLAACPACAAELAGFRRLPALLDRVPADEVTAEPVTAPPELFARVSAAVRQPVRRRRMAGAAAAAVLVTGGVTWAAVRGADVDTAEAGGVRMSVAAEGQGVGSALDVTVAGLPAGVECELAVVDEDGGWHPEGDWTTYGGELSYRLETDVPPGELAEVVLQADGEEVVRVHVGD
jgi:anti-sigma factor RsiW